MIGLFPYLVLELRLVAWDPVDLPTYSSVEKGRQDEER